MSMNPIFILGAPRSGTTFLASLLDKTKYGPPFETQFIIKYYNKLSNYGDLKDLSNFTRLVKEILSERAVMQWDLNLDINVFFKELDGDLSYSNITNKLCLKASQKNGFDSWGDKTPDFLGDLDTLFTLFPDSKYLYIVRDGRDVNLSLLEKDWGPNNVYYSAKYWNHLNQEHSALKKLKDKNNLFFLKYEDLLDNVDEYIKKIYHFLNMEFSDEDVSLLSSSVRKGNYNKWKSKMSSSDIKVFENIAAETLQRFDYETTYAQKDISTLKKVYYIAHNALYRVKHLFIINVIDGIKIRFFGKQPFAE